MAKKGERKIPARYHLLYEDNPACEHCGAMHATGGIDEWGCAACGEKGFEDDDDFDD